MTTTMRTDSESPPPKKIRLGLQQNQENVAAVHHKNTTTTRTTIHQLSDGVIEISLVLLGGHGHFRDMPLACKMFLSASELNPHFKKITTGESVISSISCAKKFFQNEGTDTKELEFFWYNAARYGRVEVMVWAYWKGYSAVWTQERNYDWVLNWFMHMQKSSPVRTTSSFAKIERDWLRLGQGYLF